MKHISLALFLFFLCSSVAFAQTSTPTPTLPSLPNNAGSWWGCYTTRSYVGGSWSAWSNFVCSPSETASWQGSRTVTSASGDGLRQEDMRFSFHAPNGVTAFTLYCGGELLMSCTSPASCGVENRTQAHTNILTPDAWNKTTSQSFQGSATWGANASFMSTWYTNANALPLTPGASTYPQIRLYVTGNGVGSLTATSNSSFICSLQAYVYNGTVYGWYNTPTPVSTPTPTITPTPTPVPDDYIDYTPFEWEPVTWVTETVSYTGEYAPTTDCYFLIPDFDYGTYSIAGYSVDLSFTGFSVCVTEFSFGLVWAGIDFTGWFYALVVIGAFGILYSRMG